MEISSQVKYLTSELDKCYSQSVDLAVQIDKIKHELKILSNMDSLGKNTLPGSLTNPIQNTMEEYETFEEEFKKSSDTYGAGAHAHSPSSQELLKIWSKNKNHWSIPETILEKQLHLKLLGHKPICDEAIIVFMHTLINCSKNPKYWIRHYNDFVEWKADGLLPLLPLLPL